MAEHAELTEALEKDPNKLGTRKARFRLPNAFRSTL
jgi:hypothetical protein